MYAEAFGTEAIGFQRRRPMLGAKARLQLQLAHELHWIVQMLPDARQQQCLLARIADNQPVDVGAERAQEFLFARARNAPRRGQDGDMQFELGQLRLRQRRKARIAKTRFERIVSDIGDERTMREHRASAAAQLAADAERDEGGALRREHPRKCALDVQTWRLSAIRGRLLHHLAGEIEKRLARARIDLCRMGIFKGKRAITDDAVAASARISGIAHIERCHAQVSLLRLIEQTVD